VWYNGLGRPVSVEDNSQSTTDMAGPTACEKRWAEFLASFETNIEDLLSKHQDSIEIRLIHAGLITLGKLVNILPSVNDNGASWIEITSRAEAEMIVLCKHLEGKPLFTAMLRLYAATHRKLRDSLQTEPDQEKATEEFREQRRRKRNPSDEQPAVLKKTAGSVPAKTSPTGVSYPPKTVVTRNFFAPLRVAEMDTESSTTEGSPYEESAVGKRGRPPPIVLTSATNLIQLQKQLKNVVEDNFEFQTTRNGTRVTTKSLADFQSIKAYFENQRLSYFTFFPKSEKPIKAVIRHCRLTPQHKTYRKG
jgi:hypothetical protein